MTNIIGAKSALSFGEAVKAIDVIVVVSLSIGGGGGTLGGDIFLSEKQGAVRVLEVSLVLNLFLLSQSLFENLGTHGGGYELLVLLVRLLRLVARFGLGCFEFGSLSMAVIVR